MLPTLAAETAKSKFLRVFKDNYYEADKIAVIDSIGNGAFASVFKCTLKNGNTTETVAVKKMDPSLFQDEQDVLDFFRETKFLATSHHPNIISFIGVTFASLEEGSEASMCIIEEFMNEGSLKAHIDAALHKERDLTEKECLELMIDVARGLAFLHEAGTTVIHRDIKPANILVSRDEKTGKLTAKLSDFGLSVLMFERPGAKNPTPAPQTETLKPVIRKSQTMVRSISALSDFADAFRQSRSKAAKLPGRGSLRTDELCCPPEAEEFYALSGKTGSLAYMAPEVFRNREYNFKADVFSFSIVLFEVLNLVHPYIHYAMTHIEPSRNEKDALSNSMEKYAGAVSEGYRPGLTKKWPKEISTLLKQSWAAKPDNRPCMPYLVSHLESFHKNCKSDSVFLRKTGCFGCL